MMYPYFGYMGWFGGIFMFIFWIIILIVMFFAIKMFVGKDMPGNAGQKTPLDILKERYAKGEIDNVEYEKMKNDLAK